LYLFNSVAIFTLLLTNERKATLIVHWLNEFSVHKTKTIVFIILVFSWLGIPPLLGFWAKWAVLLSTISFNNKALIVLLILFSIILSSFYYLRLVKNSISQSRETYYTWKNNLLERTQQISLNHLLVVIGFNTVFFFAVISLLFTLSQTLL
jgi:NADH:ubiquinone oxidoreductase subunit 2 (subunit N)